MSSSGQRVLVIALGRFRNPPGWATLQNPITHRKSYGFTELGRMALILSYLLASVKATDVKPNAYAVLVDLCAATNHTAAASSTSGLQQLTRVFVALADHIALCLQKSFTEEEYVKLDCSALAVRRSFQEIARCYDKGSFEDNDLDSRVADSLGKLPNVHIGMHLADTARRIGTLLNGCSSMGEERHKMAKRDVLHVSTAHEPIKQLLLKANIAQTLQSIALGTYVTERPFISTFLMQLKHSCPKLYASLKLENRTQIHDTDTLCCRMPNHELKRLHLPYNLATDGALCKELSLAYVQDLKMPVYDVGVGNLEYGTKATTINKETGTKRAFKMDQSLKIGCLRPIYKLS